MERNVKISILLDIYKNMLTDRQADIVDLYYNQNLSLSEIADEIGVTRQAIRKSLVEAEKNLIMLEDKLNICEKNLSLYFYILYIGTFTCIILIFHHVTLHGHKLGKVNQVFDRGLLHIRFLRI